jgi:hypothetical protein
MPKKTRPKKKRKPAKPPKLDANQIAFRVLAEATKEKGNP